MKLKVKWFLTDKPFQNFPSAINSLDWEEEWTYRRRLGEQWPAERKYNGLWSMPGLAGDHFCGKPDMFVNGAPMLTEPVQLDPDGIPACCGRGMIGFAAAGAVGASYLSGDWYSTGVAFAGAVGASYLGRVLPLDGSAFAGAVGASYLGRVLPLDGSAFVGAVGAGQLGNVWPMESQITAGADAGSLLSVTPTLDGLALAGAVGDSYLGTVLPLDGSAFAGGLADGSMSAVQLMVGTATAGGDASGDFTLVLPPPPPPPPPPPAPGSTCATAGTFAPGQSYSGTAPAGSTSFDWFKFTTVAGAHYTITISGSAAGHEVCHMGDGSCASLIERIFPFGSNGSAGFTAGSSGTGFFWVGGAAGGTYTVALSSP